MDTKLLTFLTLCRTMNYRRAAEQLHLTQPAVTKQIQSLEAQYGVKLFSYDGRRLCKTPQGETLERYAIGQQYNDAELTRLLAGKPKTLLRIGATKSIGDYILIPEIRHFLAQPENELFFTVDNTAHLLAQLEAGELDFVILEGIFDKRRYDYFLLREEPYIGICAAGHPWSGRKVDWRMLFSERLILREPGSGTRNILERELNQQGYDIGAFKSCVCISSFKIIRELVAAGCGISFLYEAVVKDAPQFGHFYCPPLTGVHELNVVFLHNTGAGAFARRFLEREPQESGERTCFSARDPVK